ncbi:MAG: hypothetical protein IJV43_04575 [Oscillospiraceae bacterium]|nr:hypothetical protein [Oscillospiraceae bacterium]
MNITTLTGVNAYRKNAAAERLQKAAKPKSGATSPARTRDRVELQFTDVLKAENEGYIEVNGNRFSVTADMASQMRKAYDEMIARNEAKMALRAAEAERRNAKAEADAMKEEAKAMKQAMEIARRISKGGRVPPQDEKFLMEYSQEMYMAAKMMAILAKEHKKEDSVLEDEEEAGETGEVNEDGDTRATVEASLSDGAVEGVSVGEAPVEAGAE